MFYTLNYIGMLITIKVYCLFKGIGHLCISIYIIYVYIYIYMLHIRKSAVDHDRSISEMHPCLGALQGGIGLGTCEG